MSTVGSLDEMVTCPVCDIQFMSKSHYALHTKGMVHSQRAQEIERKKDQTAPTIAPPAKMVTAKPDINSHSNPQQKIPEKSVEKTQNLSKNEKEKNPEPIKERKPDDAGVHCEACNVSFKAMQQFLSHAKGLGHIQNVERFESKNRSQNTDPPPKTEEAKKKEVKQKEEDPLPPGNRNRSMPASCSVETDSLSEDYLCETCNIKYSSLLQYSRHVNSDEHLQTARSVLQDSMGSPKSSKHPLLPLPKPPQNSSRGPLLPSPKEQLSRGPLLPSPDTPASSSRGPLLPSPNELPSSSRGPLLPSPNTPSSSSRSPLLPEPSRSTQRERAHQDFFCDACDMKFDNTQQFQSHIKGISHHQNVELKQTKSDVQVDLDDFGFCDLCNISFYTMQDYRIHLKGKAHLFKQYPHLKPTPAATASEEPVHKDMESTHIRCEVCDVTCAGPVPYESHLNGQKHRKRLKAMGVKATQQKSLVQPAPSFRPDEVRCQRELDSCKEPLIGIEFLTEYHPAKRRSVLSYRCSLCQCTFNQSSLISHIIGSRHRIKFFEHYDLGLNGRDHRGVRVMKPADTHKYADEIERRQGRKKMKIKNCDVNDDDLEIDLSNVEMIDEWSESGNDVQHRREDVDQRMNHMRRADVDERFHRREPVVIDYGHKIRENIDVDHRRPNERFDNDAYYRDEGRSYDADHDRQQLQHYEQSYKPQDEEASRPDPVAEFHKRLQAVSDNRAAQGYEENTKEQRVVSSSSSGYETQPNIPPRRLEEPLSKRRPVQDEAPPAAKRSRPAEESVQLDNQKMLQSLASCMMSSDDDVQLALKVSNALAKAILEYRLRYINSYEAGEELTAQLRLLTDEADNISEQVQDGQASNVQGEKLLSLVQSMVQSEQDLETAMDVSKALTKAILDYRMKALTDDVQEAPPSQIAPAYAHSTPSSTPYAPSPSMHAAPTPPSYAPPPASTFAPSSTAAFLPSSFMPAYAFAPTPSPQPLMCMPGASMLDRPPSPPPPPPPDEEKPPLPDSPPPGVFCRKTNKNKKSFRFGL